jgi:hypothetical protein
MAGPPDRWTLAGVVIQGYLKALDRLGLREAVRERVPQSTRIVMDKPPLVVSAVDAAVLDDMLVAVAALRGSQAPRELALAAVTDSFGPVMTMLLFGMIRLFGPSPETLFERLGIVTGPMAQGVEFQYRSTGERAGVVTLSFPSPVSQPMLSAWEGILEYGYVVCNTTGTARKRGSSGGRVAEIDVQWDAPVDGATQSP